MRTSPSSTPEHGPHVAVRIAPWALLVTACFAAFLPCLTFDLLRAWDDQVYVLNNVDALAFSWANVTRWFARPFFANYHPLTMLTYMVDYRLWGLWGPGYHLQNLIWHVVTVLAVYQVALRLRLDRAGALVAALLWAVHPLRVESVVWVSERKDVVCGAFYCWGLVWAARERPGPERRIVPFLFFILAYLAKSMAVSFPFVLLCLDWTLGGRQRVKARLKGFWPYLILLALMVPVTFLAQASEHGVRGHWDVLHQVGVAWSNLFRYVVMTLAPVGLNPIYPLVHFGIGDWTWGAAATAVLAGGAVVLWRRSPGWFYRVLAPAAIAYGIMLLPVSGIVPLGGIDYADRYAYLPTLPLFLLAGAGLERLRGRFGNLRVLTPAAAVFAGLALTTYWTCYTWQDIETLFGAAAAVEDPNPVASGAWANCLIRMGRVQEALAIAEQGLRMHPRNPKFHYIKARCLDRMGRHKAALKIYEGLIGRLETTDFYAGLADCYRDAGAPKRAETFYSMVLDDEPRNFDVLLNRGAVRFTLGKYSEAVGDFRAAAAIRSDRPEPLLNLARTLAAMGDMKQAKAILERARVLARPEAASGQP